MLPDAARSAGPAAVHDPRLGVVLLELVLEDLGVPRGVEGDEGGAKSTR